MDGFEERRFDDGRFAHNVFKGGSGPPVIVLHEVAGLSPGAVPVDALGDVGHKSRVSLHFTVHRNFNSKTICQIADNRNGPGHLLGGARFRAALRRKAEHGDSRTCSEHLSSNEPRLHCNRGELLHIGVRHDAAIGKEQDTIVAKFLVGKFRDEATRNKRRMRETPPTKASTCPNCSIIAA